MSVASALRALNNAVLDLQAADFNTYERPLQQMGAALANPSLASIVGDLRERADFDSFLEGADKGGGMMGSARLNWPTDEAITLGLVIHIIERASSDPGWFSALAHRYYYAPNNKIIGDIRKITTAVIVPFNRDFATYVQEHPIEAQLVNEPAQTAPSRDKHDLLAALYELSLQSDKRPSVMDARTRFLPEWDSPRAKSALNALLNDGDVINPKGAPVYVDIASHARKRIEASSSTSQPSVTYNIGSMSQSPIQHVEAFGYGVQITTYSVEDLSTIIDIYHKHVEELGLGQADRRRADAQVATIEAQLLDEPDPSIVQTAGRSLKAIVEGALGGAIGNALASTSVWAPLLALF